MLIFIFIFVNKLQGKEFYDQLRKIVTAAFSANSVFMWFIDAGNVFV